MEETLAGRLEGDQPGIVLARLDMKVRGEVVRRSINQAVRLVCDDGDEVALDPSRLAGVLPVIQRGGRWSELANSPLGRLFADAAPGDHVDVSIEGWMFEHGERVVVRGTRAGEATSPLPSPAPKKKQKITGARAQEVEERLRARRADQDKLQADPDPGGFAQLDRAARRMREEAPPPPVLATAASASIVVRRIAVVDVVAGDAAAVRMLDDADRAAVRVAPAVPPPRPAPRPEKPPRMPKPWKIAAPIFLVIAAGLGVAGVALWRDPIVALLLKRPAGGYALVSGAGVALAIALAMLLSRPPFETIDSRAGGGVFHPTWAIGKVSMAFFMVSAFFVPFAGGFPGMPRIMIALPLFGIAAYALGLFLWCTIKLRRSVRLARLLLSGPNRITGTVRASGTVAERTVKYVQRSRTSTETVRTEDGGTATRTTTSYWVEGLPGTNRVGELEIVDGDRTIAVVGQRAFWGAPLAYTKPKKTGDLYTTRAAIEDGDSIVARGRVVDEGGRLVIHAGGAEAFVMFGAPEDARGTLLALALNWLANAGALAGLGVASLVYALLVVL